MTTDLLSLINQPATPAATADLTPEAEFALWRERNANAVEYITRLSISNARRGARRLSMKSMFEAARAAGAFGDSTTTEPFRLNNNRTAQMSRWVMERHPVLDGLFATRRRRAA